MKVQKSIQRLSIWILIICFVFSVPVSADNAVKVVLLPFRINSPDNLEYIQKGIRDMLASRISAEDKVVVLEDTKVNELLSQMPQLPSTETEIKAIGVQLGADFIVSGSLTKIGRNVSIDANVLDLRIDKRITSLFTTSEGIDNVIPEISRFALKAGAGIAGSTKDKSSHSPPVSQASSQAPVVPSASPVDEKDQEPETSSGHSPNLSHFTSSAPTSVRMKFWKSQKLETEIIGLDLGDVNGDGKNETVVMEHNRVAIYKHAINKLVLIQEIEGTRTDNYISLDVADINGNGIPEIFITNLVDKELSSFVIEFQEGDFRKIVTGIKYFLKVSNTSQKGLVLLGQKAGMDGTFHGSVRQLVWKNNIYDESESISLPSGSIVYGFNLIDLDKDETEEIVLIDNNDYLKVFSEEGELMWKSDEIYGGTLNFLIKYPDSAEPNQFTEELETRLYMQNRVLFRHHKGANEVIVIKNIPKAGKLFERIRAYGKSEVYNFVWDGLGLSENWRSQKIHGYISDFQIKDIDNDNQDELVVGIVQLSIKSMFKRAKSYVLAYDLRG